MLTILMINFTLSIIFLTLTHPISLGMILLIQTILISMITGNFSLNFWFSYILFLIMIGGMLILFIYMTSIASNEKFKFKPLLFTLMIIPLISFLLPTEFLININNQNTEILMFNFIPLITKSMTKFINFQSNFMLIFLIIYLFLTLIATVKITNFKTGPLRQKN
uniref:NADH-ubiquinone oxidoreductase chain 6 n=1 Tax=Nacerdes carniolica TaxID=1586422 RepID=A0A343C1R5_9CUCU|nr:NADH dehydrogenase subunit 6 [Nacerdes carniolica]